MTVQEIIDLMPSPSESDTKLVKKAYEFAERVHKDHTRYSGEPYFIHLFETAKNLAGIGMGANTIAAGFLHDCIEDVGVKEEEIEKQFGKEILFLVQGVTKLGHLRYQGHERHIESLKKLLIATSEDIRVLIIKLADRLHNMRTIKHVPKQKQTRIASETLEIYAPLAYRLGIRKFNRELEDLSFQALHPEEYEKVKKLVKQKNREKIALLEKFSKSLRKELGLQGLVQFHTDYRIKNIYSLHKKLLKKEGEMEKIYDVSAIRVIVPTVSDCYKALGIIHGAWRPLPGRIKDYIAFPKPNGYQSIHTTIFTGDGGIVEIQIRSEAMHIKAEYGVASHIAYKEQLSKGNNKQTNLLWIKDLLPRSNGNLGESEVKPLGTEIPNWIKDLVDSQALVSEEKEFMENLKTDFVKQRVFAFTPHGDVVDLPIDSSPIDFAYAIHSDIGNHIFGTKVNGKQVSLNTTLHNGDIVEIQTRNSSHPTSKWLDFAKTTLAKKHIRIYLEGKGNKKIKS